MSKQVRFCNRHARVAASLMAHCYFAAVELNVRWVATGAGERLAVLGEFLQRQARRMEQMFFACKKFKSNWLAEMSAVIPNDATVIDDGAPANGRLQIDGAAVHLLANRVNEMIADWGDTGAGNWKMSNIVRPIDRITGDSGDLTLAEITEIINHGNNDLIAPWEAASSAKLNTILAVSVIDGLGEGL